MRSTLTTHIKDSMFAVLGESQLDSINTSAAPGDVARWKRFYKTKKCWKNLFKPIDSTNSEQTQTYMEKILERLWPGALPSNIKLAYAISVCEIMLSPHYEKLTMSKNIVKSRLAKNLVSIFKLI